MQKIARRLQAGLLILLAIGAPPVHAGPFLESMLGCTGDVCVVRDNMGGDLLNYLMAAREALKEHKQIVIDGWCVSACSIVADRVRSLVCITPNARFGFHKTWALVLRSDGAAYSKPGFHKSWTYTPALQRWINKKGGEPVSGLLVMSSAEAGAFWPRCRQSVGFF